MYIKSPTASIRNKVPPCRSSLAAVAWTADMVVAQQPPPPTTTTMRLLRRRCCWRRNTRVFRFGNRDAHNRDLFGLVRKGGGGGRRADWPWRPRNMKISDMAHGSQDGVQTANPPGGHTNRVYCCGSDQYDRGSDDESSRLLGHQVDTRIRGTRLLPKRSGPNTGHINTHVGGRSAFPEPEPPQTWSTQVQIGQWSLHQIPQPGTYARSQALAPVSQQAIEVAPQIRTYSQGYT